VDVKKALRVLARVTLLEHVVELLYWLLVIVGLVSLVRALPPEPWLMALASGLYLAAVLALYWVAVKRVKAFFRDGA
jgi:hypothetical protein